MAAKLSWYFGSKVVLCTLTGQMSRDSLKQIDNQVPSYLSQGKSPVHVFVDVRKLDKFPLNLLQVKTVIQSLHRPSMGWEILIGYQNPLLRFIAAMVAQLSGIQLQMVDTLEQAVAFLARIDPELPDPGNEDTASNSLFVYANPYAVNNTFSMIHDTLQSK